ncbi:MAG: hypothetical protein JST38_19610 [Bacteroidetes bacterium]|nr:hypothetical protein [Bacteroidota bacterium]MBS1943076.1 hypothetical protein [Bacteroidota bacterium]
MNAFRVLTLAAFVGRGCQLVAQATGAPGDRVEVLNADRWDFNKDVATGAQRLSGHVRFGQGGAVMACDSAWLFDDQRVNAFGHVNLRQGDTLQITGDKLQFSGKDHLARMEGNVVLSDPGMELTTEALTYDVRARRADYNSGAHITDRREGNTLSSMHGTYFAGNHAFVFSGNVRLEHPDRTILADTLQYSSSSGTAFFLGPTHILQGATTMYCEQGSYDTRTGFGRFTKAGRITSGAQELTGDSLHYNRSTGEGTGWGHVTVKDTVNRTVVHGNYGTHRQAQGNSMVTGRAELIMLAGADSLYLHGDTLFAQQDSSGHKHILARRNVRFFKPDLQGVCDTMTYNGRDSLITLRGQPFIWSKGNQLSGDTVFIRMHNGHAQKLTVDGAALMVEQADSSHFNQVAGTTLTGYFHGDQIRQIVAEGNSRTIYFAREKKDSTERITGVNRADCSRITVGLDSGKVSTVSFITQPDGTMYPLDKAPPEALLFENFLWNAAARPVDRGDIFRETSDEKLRPGQASGTPIR